jgi:excisionase family DNA binding protein
MPLSTGSLAGDQVQPGCFRPVSARRKGSDDADGPQFRVLYVRPVEAAAMMRISRSKFYEMMQRGEIGSCVIGGLRRVPVAEVERFAAKTRKAADRIETV